MRRFLTGGVNRLAIVLLSFTASGISTARPVVAADVVTYEITADEMCCGGCAKKVAAQLYTAPGVSNVKANVAGRTVTITAKPSPKLTMEKLWSAVEKGKGKPSKLVSPEATYTLTPLDPATQQASAGVYTVVVLDLKANGVADKVGRELQTIRGVKTVVLHLDQDALVVESHPGVQLSPFALASAVERSGQQPSAIVGSYGQLTIEPSTAKVSARQATKGSVR
ncbi:heavy-metal-associated domain-containing protein [Lacipirellula limnantheis]|uniref:Heavy-metal-associated domain protein n=1 Tax=Lacipirellula limnantheis TaxID=2528024 RepID=A0A517TSH0_9BACT|nr:heavy-metal-associated domain-containing protein [Lacipirellula limnantheis]QDT71322.1 Heavy-metal-associated domain protein [Lacipirellula limnantheis]